MKKVLLVLLIAVVAFLAYAATRPDTYRVERSATISAPAELIYPRIVDFQAFQSWSPWEELDPAMNRQLAGTPGELGATYDWAGNKDVGKGRMTLIEAKPSSTAGIRLDFLEPMASTSTIRFDLAPAGDATRVNWTMDGEHTFISKVMCIFMDMDAMVGKDFEKGLASLKAESEAAAAAAAAAAAEPAAEGDGMTEGEAPADGAEAPAPTDEAPAAEAAEMPAA